MVMLSLCWFLSLFFVLTKSFLIISNFFKIDKTIVSNWYQNLDDKPIRQCVESVLESLDSRLTYHRSWL